MSSENSDNAPVTINTMSAKSLLRLGVLGAALTVLVAAEGVYMLIANHMPSGANRSVNVIFSSDGGVVVLMAILLAVLTAALFAMWYTQRRAETKAASAE